MTPSQHTLINLIKNALFDIPVGEELGDADWTDIMREAQVQSVAGIAAAGVPPQYKDRWREVKYALIDNNVRNLCAQDELVQLLEANDIPYAIVKGAAAAVYYPHLYQRTMGDIDFIVLPGCFEKARETLILNKYAEVKYGNGLDDRHVHFKKGNALFEMHHRFSYSDLDIEKYISEGFKSLEEANLDGHSFRMLPAAANGIVLLAHMRSHLKSGMGLRQVIDWMMFVHRELDDTFWDRVFRQKAEETGLCRLAMTITQMCRMYLGLPDEIAWCSGADKKVCEDLMDEILLSGDFGDKKSAGDLAETVATFMRREGVFRYLQFGGESNWKAYHKHKWLKPFCWIYQAFHYVKKSFSTGRRKQLADGLDRSKTRHELLKKLDR